MPNVTATLNPFSKPKTERKILTRKKPRLITLDLSLGFCHDPVVNDLHGEEESCHGYVGEVHGHEGEEEDGDDAVLAKIINAPKCMAIMIRNYLTFPKYQKTNFWEKF